MSPLLTARPDATVHDQASTDADTMSRETARDDVIRGDLSTGGPSGPAGPAAAKRHSSSALRRLMRDGRFWTAAPLLASFVAMAFAPGLFTRVDPAECRLARSLGSPQTGHPFGFDLLGCDYFTRTVYGARTSLVIAVTVVVLALAIAVLFGALAGMAGA